MNFEALISAARKTVREMHLVDIQARMPNALFADVREIDEWNEGHIPGALHLPLSLLDVLADPNSPDASPEITERRDGPVVVYCQFGKRSLIAGRTLQGLGYRYVVSLKGGYFAWKLHR